MNERLARLFLTNFPEQCDRCSAFNRAGILGRVEREFKSVFRTQTDVFLEATICVKRKSGMEDRIRVILPRKILTESSYEGKMVSIVGQIRFSREGNYLWGKSILICKKDEDMRNLVCLEGEVKENPYYIPISGNHARAEMKIVVKRNFDKQDIILTWSGDQEARRVSRLWKGDTIELCGRIQSFQECSATGKLRERCRILIQHHELVEVK